MDKINQSNDTETNKINEINEQLTKNNIMLLKFDTPDSKYDEYINSLNYKIVNITDTEIINFYDIDFLPTILIYKNKNLIDSIEGFLTKTQLLKKINYLIN